VFGVQRERKKKSGFPGDTPTEPTAEIRPGGSPDRVRGPRGGKGKRHSPNRRKVPETG